MEPEHAPRDLLHVRTLYYVGVRPFTVYTCTTYLPQKTKDQRICTSIVLVLEDQPVQQVCSFT